MDVHGHGSDWDAKRNASRYWIRLETGQEYEGFGATVESARASAVASLEAAGFVLSELGGLASSVVEEVESDAVALRRCPGGLTLAPEQDYARAFVAGAPITVSFLEGPSPGVIEVELAGLIDLPTGRVAAYDPLTSRDAIEPFEVAVSPGRYPVLVSLAQIQGEPRRRTIAAAIRFSEKPVATWVQALCVGEDPRQLPPREMFGYAVDTGTGCFASAEFDPETLGELDLEDYSQPDPQSVVFSTGWGDGRYATFLGRDASGDPAMLVTDFALLAPHTLGIPR